MGAKGGEDTIVRHWKLMKALPTEPRWVTVAQLCAALQDDGITVSRRTVERDLRKLSAVPGIPIFCREGDGIDHWAWMRDGQSQFTPKPDLGQAMLLVMARRYMEPLLAPVLMQALAPTFTAAERALTVAKGRRTTHWSSKIGAVPPTRPLDRPRVPTHRPDVLVEALLGDRKVHLAYQIGREDESFTVNPYALIQREFVTYLLATCDPHRDVRALALHRMRGPSIVNTPAIRVPGFDLSAYIAAGFEEFG